MSTSFKDSAIFTKLVNQSSINRKLGSLNLEDNAISDETLKNNLFTVKRRVTAPGKGDILEHIEKDKDFIIINSDAAKLPTYVNYFPINFNGKVLVVIDVNRIMKSDGSMFPKTFFAYLQNGLISYNLTANWNKYTTNSELTRFSALAYSQIMMRVFDKLYGISLYPEWADLVSFMLAKFFMINMEGRGESKVVDSLAYNAVTNNTAISKLLEAEKDLNGTSNNSYGNFFDLCKRLQNIPVFKQLNERSIIENYIRLYGESTLLSMDFLPAFWQMIFATQVNGEINNEYRINDTAGNAIKKAYGAYARLLK